MSSGPETLAGGGMLRDLRCCISGPGLRRVNRLRAPAFNDCWLNDLDLAIGAVAPRAPRDDVKGELPPAFGAAVIAATPADFATSDDVAIDGLADPFTAVVSVVEGTAFLALYFWYKNLPNQTRSNVMMVTQKINMIRESISE